MTDGDTVIARILAEVRVEPLVLDRDNIEMATEDATLDARRDPNRFAYHFDDEGPVALPATRFVFSIPFTGDPNLWGLAGNTIWAVFARGYVSGSGNQCHLQLAFTKPKDSHDDLQEHLEAELKLINDNRDQQRPEIEAFNAQLRDQIAAAVNGRRSEFARQADLAKKMGVRLASPTPSSPPSQHNPSKEVAVSAGPKKWDAFVSYAGEDRAAVALPLAGALRSTGIKVWFDKFELSLGDRLRRKIDEGLAQSRYGIVVLSPAFLAKHWPQLELDGLAQREVAGDNVILPVWYMIDRDGVAAYSPTLADRVAVEWSDGIDAVVASIVAVVSPTTIP